MAREGRDVISHVGVAALTLFACAGAFGALFVWLSRLEGWLPYFLVLGIPLMSTIVFMFVATAVPALFGSGKIAFPLTLSLPVVYCTLLVLSVVLWSSTDNSLVRPNDALSVLRVWLTPGALGLVLALQFAALTLVGKLRR